MIDKKHSTGMALHSRMLAIDLRHLRYAVAARDQGSFRLAAESLLVQQSTLSRCIRQAARRRLLIEMVDCHLRPHAWPAKQP
jgi:hypothetical protein